VNKTATKEKGLVMYIRLILGALFAAPAIASASEWKAMASSVNNFVFIDVQSIQTQGKLQKAWFISNRDKAEAVPGTATTMYLSSKYLAYFSCADKTISTAAVYLYAEQYGHGQSIASSTARGEAIEVAPDSVNEEMLRFVCTKRKNKG
jgi:hypothetical protein